MRLIFGVMLVLIIVACDVTGHPREACKARCRITVERAVAIGDAGSGAVDHNQIATIVGDETFVSHLASPNQVQVFDASGRFSRLIGHPGEGPAELEAISDLLTGPDGNLWVIDQGNLALKTFSPAGDFLGTTPLPFLPRRSTAVLLPDSSLIINGMAPTADLIGHWTHRWHPRVGFLWSSPGESTLARGRAEPRHYAVDESSVWVLRRNGEFVVERLELSTGRRIALHRVSRPWFDEFQEERLLSGGPEDPTALVSPVAWITDARLIDGRLWVLGYTADPSWKSARDEGFRNLGVFLDNIVDIYDPETMDLLASARLDVSNTLLTDFLGSDQVFGHETTAGLDRLTIYDVRVRGSLPSPGRRW